MVGRIAQWTKVVSLWALGVSALVVPGEVAAEEIDLDLEFGASPAEATEAVDADFDGGDWREYARRDRTVRLNDETWTHFLIFYDDELIAQGYERDETPQKLRVGTLSDIVSYDNDYWVASALTADLGAPDFKEVRTKGDYSEELGDPAKRATRSVDWDLRGERFRWETDSGPVRYSVKFSLKGKRNHRLVKVDPDALKHYHFYQTARAFRRAGIHVIRRFERRSKKMVVAMVTSSGETVKTEVESDEDELVPVQPEKRQHRHDRCKIDGHDCSVTYHTYGGWIYKVEVDLSSSGRVGRRERGAFDKVGERVYRRFLTVNSRLEAMFGEPTADTSVTELTDDRKKMKVQRLPQGMEAFWTVWYNPGRDMLTRNVITGGQSGAEWHVDHRVVFRLHSVTRAFADQRAWKQEEAAMEETSDAASRNAEALEGGPQIGGGDEASGEDESADDESDSDSED